MYAQRPVGFPMDLDADRRRAIPDLAAELDLKFGAVVCCTNFQEGPHELLYPQEKEILYVRIANDLATSASVVSSCGRYLVQSGARSGNKTRFCLPWWFLSEWKCATFGLRVAPPHLSAATNHVVNVSGPFPVFPSVSALLRGFYGARRLRSFCFGCGTVPVLAPP